jgi:hypothetical protein
LAQALTAFGRAIRAHRRLARLAPAFFDAAVVNREAENRAEQRRWLATWEPALAKAYGVEPRTHWPEIEALPSLPSPRLQREVDRLLAEWKLWLTTGQVALARYQQRSPHDQMSWSRMARLLASGMAFGQLASGLNSPNRVPEKLAYDYELTGLKRSYGQPMADESGVPASRADFPADAPTPVISPPPESPVAQPAPLPPVVAAPVPPRCDAWCRWARQMQKRK